MADAKIQKELVAASSVPILLSVLKEGESYGYAIIQRVRELSGGQLEWSEGMLYPVLHRLERQGLIASSWSKASTGRRRKSYKIKAQGKKAIATHRAQWTLVDATLKQLWEGTPA